MKVSLALLALSGVFLAARFLPCPGACPLTRPATLVGLPIAADGACESSCHESAPLLASRAADVTEGRYVEARTASVFAGACHYNSEATTQGRRAVLAGVLDAGVREGVDLAGRAFVAVVAAPGNLADGGARRSGLFLPAGLPAAELGALERAVREDHARALGTVERVVAADLQVDLDAESYRVRVEDEVELEGRALADRACCKMPLNVWYDPLTDLDDSVVGCSRLLRVKDLGLGPAFERFDENDAFLGTFRRAPAQLAASATASVGSDPSPE